MELKLYKALFDLINIQIIMLFSSKKLATFKTQAQECQGQCEFSNCHDEITESVILFK